MVKFPIEKIIIEGPDLAGKTTLFSKIHELTQYRWNIQDRSALSMLVYAKLYDRDTFHLVLAVSWRPSLVYLQMRVMMP